MIVWFVRMNGTGVVQFESPEAISGLLLFADSPGWRGGTKFGETHVSAKAKSISYRHPLLPGLKYPVCRLRIRDTLGGFLRRSLGYTDLRHSASPSVICCRVRFFPPILQTS